MKSTLNTGVAINVTNGNKLILKICYELISYPTCMNKKHNEIISKMKYHS